MKKKNVTLGWKPQKSSLERKQEYFRRLMAEPTEEWKVNNQEASEASEVLNHFRNPRTWTFYLWMSFPNNRVYHGGSWRLSNYHIQKLEKMNLFKMSDFQRILVSKKRLENVPPLFSTKLWKWKFSSQITWSRINVSFEKISNGDHHFFREP